MPSAFARRVAKLEQRHGLNRPDVWKYYLLGEPDGIPLAIVCSPRLGVRYLVNDVEVDELTYAAASGGNVP